LSQNDDSSLHPRFVLRVSHSRKDCKWTRNAVTRPLPSPIVEAVVTALELARCRTAFELFAVNQAAKHEAEEYGDLGITDQDVPF
jgi:hypothetical protein